MGDSYWDEIAKAYEAVSIYDGPEVLAAGMKGYPEHIRDLLAAHWFLSEMSNGGISQFFANPTGIIAEYAVDAFGRMGFTEIAKILQACISRASESSGIIAPEVFEADERSIYAIGGNDLGRIYDRMDSYAKSHKSG